MKSFIFLSRHALVHAGICVIAGMLACSNAQESDGITFGAAGWMQYSVIGKSSDSVAIPGFYKGGLDGKSVFSSGAQISMVAQPSEKLHVSAGVGMAAGNTLSGGLHVSSGYAPSGVDAYVANANFTYLFQNTANSKVSVTGGLFNYDYNPDAKNLGLYLLRGPVYPGILISGFETKHVMPVANMLGLQLHHQMGAFRQDLLLSSDMEYYPFFDLSPAYVAGYQVHRTLHIGAGVNFYHLLPVDSKLTSGQNPDGGRWTYADPLDTGGGKKPDTTNLSFNGPKVMANASFDPKPLFGGAEWLGPEDLKLYGEVALLGLDNDKAHKKIYGDYLHRMPVMVGFNLPTRKTLDHLSLEVEWYASANADNLDKYNVIGHPISPYPTNWDLDPNTGNRYLARRAIRDNWKWSLHGARTIQKHVLLSFQVANDHYRPGIFDGYADSNPPHRDAVLVTPKDWYFTTKLAYFF